jgi:hypothetical protein
LPRRKAKKQFRKRQNLPRRKKSVSIAGRSATSMGCLVIMSFTDTMNRICSDGTGEIVFRDIGHVQRCQVGTIELVENKDAARAFFDERMQYEKNRKAKDAEKE